MTTHTPGPWHVGDEDMVADGPFICAGSTMIADVWCGLPGDTFKANARLIAAAPDLLAALKHVEICASCAQADWGACPGGRQALAAIARAEGR